MIGTIEQLATRHCSWFWKIRRELENRDEIEYDNGGTFNIGRDRARARDSGHSIQTYKEMNRKIWRDGEEKSVKKNTI